MSEKLLSGLITIALNIPVFAIVVLLWTRMIKRRDYVENRTGTSIDKLKEINLKAEMKVAVLEERVNWMQMLLEKRLLSYRDKNKNTGNS